MWYIYCDTFITCKMIPPSRYFFFSKKTLHLKVPWSSSLCLQVSIFHMSLALPWPDTTLLPPHWASVCEVRDTSLCTVSQARLREPSVWQCHSVRQQRAWPWFTSQFLILPSPPGFSEPNTRYKHPALRLPVLSFPGTSPRNSLCPTEV